jgi:hypothetical protein
MVVGGGFDVLSVGMIVALIGDVHLGRWRRIILGWRAGMVWSLIPLRRLGIDDIWGMLDGYSGNRRRLWRSSW